jgi:hypothetical protein
MKQISGNVYRIPRRFNWPFVIGGFAVLALVVMLWRWGGTIEDSLAYFNTAQWLRGELAPSELRAPFPYRIAVPALAALLPGDAHNTFATLNWLFTVATACLATATARRMGFGTQRALAAGALVILSLPTFWYAPYSAGRSGLGVHAHAVRVRRADRAAAPGAGGRAGGDRDPRGKHPAARLAAGDAPGRLEERPGGAGGGRRLAAGGALVAGARPAELHLGAEPGDDRAPAVRLARPAVAGGCAGLVLPLALLGMRRAPARLQPLKSMLVLMILPPLYAALSVRVEGRIVWSLYPFLIPFAVSLGLPRRAESQPDVRELKVARRA